MEHRLSATDLARRVGDILGKIRYLGDSFLIERNGEPVARLVPLPERPHGSVAEALRAWAGAGESDAAFAADLERVSSADRPPESAWGS
jgi:antitoxin (DNA-binding transcriptional repressor) of toxin-antitoxin stability system